MSDVPPPKNAFDVLMAASKPPEEVAKVAEAEEDEPVLTAVLYEAHLEHVDESEPLWRVPYFGQAVRPGTAEAVFAARKREHETKAAREDKDLGFLAVIDRFGPEAMKWRIVSSESGPRAAMHALANAEEIRLIDENGGVLRDMNAKLTQTLNLVKGGQCGGDARAWWTGIDAKRRRALTKFKTAMEAYVKEYNSALVPRDHVDADGYPLGVALSSFRHGHMWKGMSDEQKSKAWAEALPKFAWNARKTTEFREQKRKHATEQHATKRRDELKRARPIAVPFEKNQKRRIEMRAASTDFLGVSNTALLYMISEDGKTIRRVAKNGSMGSRFIVGPVVDPPPPDAFYSD
jgi:hypothetical protein